VAAIYHLAMVLLVMWAVVALLIAGYIWFVVWRLRIERRKKEMRTSEPAQTTSASPAPAATSLRARLEAQGALPPLDGPEPLATPEPLVMPSTLGVAPTPTAGRTVTDLLTGIRLPEDLVPITLMEPRSDITERVAFASDAGADAKRVGTAFADELQRLGYEVTASGADQLAATRGDDHLQCQLHVDAHYAELGGKRAFPAVPESSVVVEVWIPF
jgi:hypothetical protein